MMSAPETTEPIGAIEIIEERIDHNNVDVGGNTSSQPELPMERTSSGEQQQGLEQHQQDANTFVNEGR
jgi:hypothetical protein